MIAVVRSQESGDSSVGEAFGVQSDSRSKEVNSLSR